MATVPRGRARTADGDGAPTLDARGAWELVRTVRPGVEAPVQVHDSEPGVSLQVYPSGTWHTRARVTGEARQVLDLYLPLQLRTDLVIAQAGQSLDGRIATASGHSHYVTGPEDIRRLHRLRALVDAVIVGAGTVEADDPRLTVREADGDNPVRVVIDPNDRLDRTRRIFSDGAAPTVVIRRRPHAGRSRGAVEPAPAGVAAPAAAPRGTTFVDLPADPSGAIRPGDVLGALNRLGCRRLLIEGGGVTVSRFLDAGVIDRMHVAVAPLLIGSGPGAFTLAPVATLDEAIRPACRVFRLGDDVLFDLDLRAPPTRAGRAGPGGPP